MSVSTTQATNQATHPLKYSEFRGPNSPELVEKTIGDRKSVV